MIMPSRSVLALSWRQHAPARYNMHIYIRTTTITIRGTLVYVFLEVRSPKHAICDAFSMLFVWFWLPALHGTSTNRMCYLSYQRACHYNAYPAQNSWQSLEQDTNTKLNNTATEKQVHKRLKSTKLKTKINYSSISLGFEMDCTDLYWIDNTMYIGPHLMQI
jgi:hypothetical protein